MLYLHAAPLPTMPHHSASTVKMHRECTEARGASCFDAYGANGGLAAHGGVHMGGCTWGAAHR
eukprot:CAMPEP_0174716210 /NCGR_PEP_ID=MMETSP1094-20130205/23279_1 /TAXON_ID=156173 /ORGANISM="Chrysochromulina brevifilum, Strain UTEX LB 985" /LENGTH=62 /DNA_ID=CAMNT_0015915905 /DNA_START=153 /DNA_END=338 /DNA_ORIENTATION=-